MSLSAVLMNQVLATWVFEPQISYVFCENKGMVCQILYQLMLTCEIRVRAAKQHIRGGKKMKRELMKQTKDDVSKLVYINGKHQERMFWNKSKRMPLFSNLYVQGRVLEFNDMYIKES